MIAVPRKVVQIDQNICNGCGLCIDRCAEAAIERVDGKATLVSDVYCDGLGACLDDCPVDAITIIERLADPFSESAVESRLATRTKDPSPPETQPADNPHHAHPNPRFGGCPSAAMKTFKPQGLSDSNENETTDHSVGQEGSALSQWPVQLRLVPPTAPFLRGRELVIAADCVAYSYAGFHRDFLTNRSVVIGCPKLDKENRYAEKLATFFRLSGITGITLIYMEVPCCHGLMHAMERALEETGASLPVRKIMFGIDGAIRSIDDPSDEAEELSQ